MGGLVSRLLRGSQATGVPRRIQLSNHTVKIVRKIGEGGFAEIYLAKEKDTGDLYALKRFTCLDDESRIHLALTEIETLKKFQNQSDFLISLVDTDNQQWVLLPFYSSGSVYSVIENERQNRSLAPYIPIPNLFTRKEIIQLMCDLCEGVTLFHHQEPPLAHRDISPGNVLLREEEGIRRAILMDFGSTAPARVKTDSYSDCVKLQEQAEATCSLLYRAPELHEVITHSTIDERSDVWVSPEKDNE